MFTVNEAAQEIIRVANMTLKALEQDYVIVRSVKVHFSIKGTK